MSRKSGGKEDLTHKNEIIRQFDSKYPGTASSATKNWQKCAALANDGKKYSGGHVTHAAVAATVKGYKNAEEGVGFANIFVGGPDSALEFCGTFFSQQLPLLEMVATTCHEKDTAPYEVILTMDVEDKMPFADAWNVVGEAHDEMYGGNFSEVIDGSGVELLHLLATILFDHGKMSDSATEEDVVNGYRTMGSRGLSLLVMRLVLALLLQKGVGRVVKIFDSDTKKPVRDLAIPVSPNFVRPCTSMFSYVRCITMVTFSLLSYY